MSDVRRSTIPVRNLEELLRLTDCSNVQDLEQLVETRVDDVASEDFGYYAVRVGHAGCLLDIRVHNRGIGLEYPFPHGDFWETIDELAEIAEKEILVKVTFDHHGFIDSEDFTNELAGFFDVTPEQILDHLGGGWRPVEASDFDVPAGTRVNWYGAGDPLQVAISFGPDTASVAVPVEIPIGLLGPAHIEYTDVVDVELHTETTLEELEQSIDAALRHARKQMTHCHGCRRYQRISQSRDGRRYCRDCMTLYFGLIID